MLVLSNVECDARSSHYLSISFNFVSKRLIDFFFSIDKLWSLDDSFMSVYSDVVEIEDLITNAQAAEIESEEMRKRRREFRQTHFESRCERIIKTVEICRDIAFFCMTETCVLLQISEHACDFH